jgi:hypothetical protein
MGRGSVVIRGVRVGSIICGLESGCKNNSITS